MSWKLFDTVVTYYCLWYWI